MWTIYMWKLLSEARLVNRTSKQSISYGAKDKITTDSCLDSDWVYCEKSWTHTPIASGFHGSPAVCKAKRQKWCSARY